MIRIHPVTLEVVRNAVFSVAEEMSAILMRSARSPLLKEAGDFSCALTDAEGRLIAQGKDIPVHLGVMAFTIKEFLKWLGPLGTRPGDVYFTNLTRLGGNHLPDVKAIRPVFFGDRLVAFAINLAHWADIGGYTAGSYVTSATEIYQEGLQISPIRLFDVEGPRREALELILANVRGRAEREGDIFAQYAANDVAVRRLQDLFAHYGRETVLACFARMLEESEEQMRAEIRRIPDGVYRGEDFMDDDGIEDRRHRIAVTVTIAGDEARFDFAGTGPQAKGPINTTAFATCSAVYYAMKALAGPHIPANDGCYRPLRVAIPPGSLLDCGPEAPVVGGNHETTQRVVDAIFRALAPGIPDRVTAGGPTTSGLAFLTGRQGDGRPFFLYEPHGGGEGAAGHRDGTNGVRVHMSNVMNTPTEIIEAEFPIEVLFHELRPGSAGAGRHRGGLGFRRAYRVLCPEAQLTTMTERCRVPPWGLFGGEPGLPYRLTLEREGERRPVPGKATVPLRRGDVLLVETCGGGGFGPAAERDPALVEADRREGYV